mgnify:CR=1 FL=1
MRTRDGHPLDEARLCFLLDALYPPAWTLSKTPAAMTTVDLRIDILTDPTPQTAPEGWAFFEFRMLDLGLGWTVDEAAAWGVDGTPLALSRQRRKLLRHTLGKWLEEKGFAGTFDLQRRAEEVPVAEFVALAQAV